MKFNTHIVHSRNIEKLSYVENGGEMGKKLKRLLTIMISAIIISTSAVGGNAYASNLQDLEHQIGVPTNKIWTIKLSKNLSSKVASNIRNYIYVTSPRDGIINGVGITYNDSNRTITITPPAGGYRTSTTYTIIVKGDLTDANGLILEAPTVMEFSTVNSNENTGSLGAISRYNLNYSLDTLVNNQLINKPVIIRYFGYTTNYASYNAVKQYTDPNIFLNDSYGIYQFMNLNFTEGINADSINRMLQGQGILNGMGQVFYDACKSANVNPAYAASHAILETGRGSSELARGVKVKDANGVERTVYNFFGIGAYDSDPIGAGSQYALKQGWFTPELAVKGGVEWIGRGYINHPTYNQNTLYKMKWNATSNGVPSHQYATDIAWAYKQIKNIKELVDKAGVAVKFDVPLYK